MPQYPHGLGDETGEVAGVASLGAPNLVNHINVPGLVRFHVTDPGLGDSAKGLYTGHLRGGVRPLLEWTTDYAEGPRYDVANRTTGSVVSSSDS